MAAIDSVLFEYPLLLTSRSRGDKKEVSAVLISVKRSGEDAYECGYQLVGIDKGPKLAFGATPIQATHLALKLISAELGGITKVYHVVDQITGEPLTADLLQIGIGERPDFGINDL